MTNEKKAQRLEDMALIPVFLDRQDAALLREAAALMRERQTVQWNAEGGDGLHRWAGPVLNGFVSLVAKEGRTLHLDWHATLKAAQAAAVAWVDGQEGQK